MERILLDENETCSVGRKLYLELIEKERKIKNEIKTNEKTRYDGEHDILYIFSGKPRAGYEDEVFPGIFIRKDEETDEVIGAIIMDYQKRLRSENNVELAKVVIEDGQIKFKVEDAQHILQDKEEFIRVLKAAEYHIGKNYCIGIEFKKSEIY